MGPGPGRRAGGPGVSQPTWMTIYSQYVIRTSGRSPARWPNEPDYWHPIGELLNRYGLTLDEAKDVTQVAFGRPNGTYPDALLRNLTEVLSGRRSVNQPAGGASTSPCPQCGYQGLLYVEMTDGRSVTVTVGGLDRTVRYVVAVCDCPHGNRVRAGHRESPWPELTDLSRQGWQPLGGWSDAHASLSRHDEARASFRQRHGGNETPQPAYVTADYDDAPF